MTKLTRSRIRQRIKEYLQAILGLDYYRWISINKLFQLIYDEAKLQNKLNDMSYLSSQVEIIGSQELNKFIDELT